MAISRLCENPECNNWFEPKHDGAKSCKIKCKNRKNYIFNSLQYSYEILATAQRKKNYQILEYLFGIKKNSITREGLELMGFSFKVFFPPLLDEENNQYYRFGNTLLKFVSETLFEIQYLDHENIQTK